MQEEATAGAVHRTGQLDEVAAWPAGRMSRRALLKLGATSVFLGTAGCSAAGSIGSGGPPRTTILPKRYWSVPTMDPPPDEVVRPASGTAPGYIFVTRAKSNVYQHGPTILDDGGNLVWFRPLAEGATNLRVQSYKGEPVITWWHGAIVPPGYGEGSYTIADSRYRTVAEVKAAQGQEGDLHEFVLTDEGTALFTVYRKEPADLSPVGGPADGQILNSLFQEVDIATGELVSQWDARQHVAFQESYLSVNPSTHLWDWFHLNSIDVDSDRNILISSRHTWTVYKLNRRSGEVIWRLNGKQSDFKMGSGASFAWQHHAVHHPGNVLTVFDDGAGPVDTETKSRGLKLQLDFSGMKATMLREYLPDPSLLASSLGSMQLLEDGHAFISWGQKGYVSEYEEAGRELFNMDLVGGSNSYRAFRFPWRGLPATTPAVAAVQSDGSSTVVHASWNGATEVDRYLVAAGSSPSQLRHAGTFKRNGFETTIRLKGTFGWVSVEALDGRGRRLGRSRPVRAY